jgi:hypothetical protein
MNIGIPDYTIDNKIAVVKKAISECISQLKPKTSSEFYSEIEAELDQIIQQEAQKAIEKYTKLGRLYKLYDKLPNNYKFGRG